MRFLLLLLCPLVARSWSANFAHAGAWVGSSLESTPLFYKGRLLLMQSQMGDFAPDGLSHSFFCIFDGASGEKLSCPAIASGYAFCSALVDDTPGRNESLWVFCSAWDRANNRCPDPGWGCGACADPAGGCHIGAFSCAAEDVSQCSWTFGKALFMPGHLTVPNVGVGLVPAGAATPAALPRHQAFMALEAEFSVAVNVGRDGDLASNWIFLSPEDFAVEGVGNSGLCPFARYDLATAAYYVGGGGNNINLMRSANLTRGSWEAPRLNGGSPIIEQGCLRGAEDCAPGSPVARIAEGLFTAYWLNGSDRGDRLFLNNLSDWNFAVNDADVCDNGTHTHFIYGQCAQTAPKNFTGKAGNFYQLGIYPGTVGEWLASYF